MNTTTALKSTNDPASRIDQLDLPSPKDFPSRHVVIFDGECSFCKSQVNRLHRWDRRNRLCFVSLHDAFVSESYPDLDHEVLMKQMFVVTPSGKRLGGARALRHLTRLIPRLWPIMPMLHIPFTLPIWQWAYSQIAKRRYRISQKMGNGCESESCKIHFD